MALVGPIKGSLGMVVLVSTTMMSGVSGSSTADTVAIGSVTISAMKRRGYPPGLASALKKIAAAGEDDQNGPGDGYPNLYVGFRDVDVHASR